MFLSLIQFCKDAFEISPLAVSVRIDESFLAITFTANVNGLLTLPGLKQSASGWWCDKWYFKTCEFYTSLNDLRTALMCFLCLCACARCEGLQYHTDLRGLEGFPGELLTFVYFLHSCARASAQDVQDLAGC